MSNHIRYNDNAKPYNNNNHKRNKKRIDEKKNEKTKEIVEIDVATISK